MKMKKKVEDTLAAESLSILVTRIKHRWHTRLLFNGIKFDEMACECRADIGYCCRQMLRWFDKGGGNSKMAAASRHRNKSNKIEGKIWWSL